MIKNLKSLFVIEDENSKKKETKSPKNSKSKDSDTKKPKSSDISKTNKAEEKVVLMGGSVDEKIVDALFGALEENNLQGFDYFEFKQSLNSLQKMVADEATRYKSAFATASTMGLTLDKLLDTAKHYSGILDRERSKFNNAAKNQRNQMVEQRKEEFALLKKTILDKKARIKEMNDEITTHEKRLSELEGSIDNAANKIENTQRNFERSFEKLKGQIEDDIAKMTKYLK